MEFKPGDVVTWSPTGRDLVTHHHRHVDAAGVPLRHDREDDPEHPTGEHLRKHHAEQLTVVRGLQNGTVLVRHEDGTETERHPSLLHPVPRMERTAAQPSMTRK